jgi:CHAT domain-containing protein/predicted negative regulator of RcsB-dependent stress response
VALALSDPTGAAPHTAAATRLFEEQRDQYGLTMVRQLEGELAVAAGDWAGARPAYASALARARAVGWVESEIGLHEALMHVALREGDLGAAEREMAAARELARARRMTGFLNTTEYYRGLLALRAGQLSEAETRLRAYGTALATQPNWRYLVSARLAEVLVRQYRFEAAERELAAAGGALDEWRATLGDRELRLLALQLAEDRSDPDLGVATVIGALATAGRGEGAFALAERRRARDLADRLNRIATLVPATGDRAVRAAPPLTARDVMAAVPDDSTAILEYVVGGGGEPTTLFAFTRRELRTYQLLPEDSLGPLIARFALLLESGADARSLGRELGAALLAPALDRLPAVVRRLVVVPDGALHRLPFDALVLPDGRHAVERFAIATAPSATIAARLWARAPGPQATAMLVLADPRFAGETRAPASGEASRTAVAGGDSLPRLRRSTREARAVARFARRATVRRREDASEAWLKHAPLTGYGVVHFATHALVDDASVANTALALAPGDGEDGFVGPGELAQLRLAAELVVLSACRTAGGVLVRGEGVQGLATPLLSAGARAVAVTWWPVGDVATVRLVSDFYGALASGLPAADALRAAKVAALERGAPAREWAAFTLVGDPLARPPVHPAPATWFWLIGATLTAAAGLLAVYGVARRRRRASERT